MPAFQRLVDDVLDQRPVDHGQHFLGHGLGRGQEAGAETGDREYSFADFHRGQSFQASGFKTTAFRRLRYSKADNIG